MQSVTHSIVILHVYQVSHQTFCIKITIISMEY
jgi:hypothetical protein